MINEQQYVPDLPYCSGIVTRIKEKKQFSITAFCFGTTFSEIGNLSIIILLFFLLAENIFINGTL